MKTYRVVFSPRAQRDLAQLGRYIAERAGAATAIGYIERVEDFCRRFDTFPKRGSVRADGSRIIGFESSASVRFFVTRNAVHIVTIAYRGRSLERQDP